MNDDVLVFGMYHREHDQRLADVLGHLEQAGVTLNEKKTKFHFSSVKLLGVFVDAMGISPDADKIKTIKDLRHQLTSAGNAGCLEWITTSEASFQS